MDLLKGTAATKAKNKYNNRNYDSVHIFVPKGRKTEILAVAEAAGDSLNGYITKAINERLINHDLSIGKKYTIIGGINGTGKSSFTGALKIQIPDLGEIIDVDKITANTGLSPINGGKTALRLITECLDKCLSFTQETTLAGRRTQVTASKAKALGYFVRLYYIGLNTPEECLERIANRVARGGHGIDEIDVRRRFAGRWDSLKKILPYCDEVKFFDNYNGFIEVAEYSDGNFRLKGEQRPEWLSELLNSLENR